MCWSILFLICNILYRKHFFSCETLYSKSCNYIHADRSKWDRPEWPLTFSTLHFDLCALTSTHPLPLRCCVVVLIHSFLIIIYLILRIIFFSFFLYPFPRQRWLSCAELEWRVRSKTVNGAGSLWGNKRQHHKHCLLFSLINQSFVFFSSLKFVHGEV